MRRSRAPRATRVAALAASLIAGVVLGGCGGEDDVTAVPDCAGTHLMVQASSRGGNGFDLFLYDLDNGGFRVIAGLNATPTDDLNPALTSDGQVIAFESARGATGVDILLFARCAGALAVQPGLNSTGDDTDPAFTADAHRIAIVRDTLGDRRIRLLDGVSDLFVPLPGLHAGAGFDDWNPSPDDGAAHIAFASNRGGGNADVFVYDRAGDSLLDLPDLISSGEDTDPWLTPNGRWLAFASSRAGGEGDLDLYLYDLQLRTFVALDTMVNSPAADRAPSLSDDGLKLAFQSGRADGMGGWDVWFYRRDLNQLVPAPQLSSTSNDVQPYLRWR